MPNPDRPETKSRFGRRKFLKLALGTSAAVLTGAVFGSEKLVEAATPPNPFFWINRSGERVEEFFINSASGREPYNNPNRPVADIYRWVENPNTNPPNLIYQPWEGLYEETQAGTGVGLEIKGLLVDVVLNKEYILTAVDASQDAQLIRLSVEVIQNANNPIDYSHNGRTRVKDALTQQGIHVAGQRITVFQFGVDSFNRKYIELGFENKYLAAEKGFERAYLDTDGNLLSFTPIGHKIFIPKFRRDI